MWGTCRGFQEVRQRPGRGCHPPLFLCPLQSLKKPIIPKEFGGKVPTVIRQRYLNLFIEECLKFSSSNQEAIEKVCDLGRWQLAGGCSPVPDGGNGTTHRGVQDAGLSGVSPQALNEEKAAYDRSPSKNIYLNVAVNTLKKLRGLAPSAVPGLSSKSVGRGGLGVASRRFRPALPAEGAASLLVRF